MTVPRELRERFARLADQRGAAIYGIDHEMTIAQEMSVFNAVAAEIVRRGIEALEAT